MSIHTSIAPIRRYINEWSGNFLKIVNLIEVKA